MRMKILFCALAICVVSSLAMAQQVSVNYNHEANFSQYHTYAWGSNNKNQIQNSILAQVAQQDIETAMANKGLQKVPESQNPDLILTASGGEREQTVAVGGVVQVEHRAALPAVPHLGAAERARRVATRWLDLRDLRAVVGEQHRGHRAGDAGREVEHHDAVEHTGHAFPLSSLRSGPLRPRFVARRASLTHQPYDPPSSGNGWPGRRSGRGSCGSG